MTTQKKKLTWGGIIGIGCFLGAAYFSRLFMKLLVSWSAPLVYFGVEKALSEKIVTTSCHLARGTSYVAFSTGQHIQLSAFPSWFTTTIAVMMGVLFFLCLALLLLLVDGIVYKLSGRRVVQEWLKDSSPSTRKEYITLKKPEAKP